jgi:hypothetical protein
MVGAIMDAAEAGERDPARLVAAAEAARQSTDRLNRKRDARSTPFRSGSLERFSNRVNQGGIPESAEI